MRFRTRFGTLLLSAALTMALGACGGGGGDEDGGSAPLEVSLVDSGKNFAAGGVALIEVSGFAPSGTVTGDINGSAVDLYRTDYGYSVALPVLDTGRYTLTLRADGESWSTPINIQATVLPTDVRGYVDGAYTDATAAIDAALASATESSELNYLRQLRSQLDAGRSALASLGDDEAAAVARFLVANETADALKSAIAKAEFDEVRCDAAMRGFTANSIAAAYGAASAAASISARIAGLVSTAARNYLISLEAAAYARKLARAVDGVESIMEACVQQSIDLILADFGGSNAGAGAMFSKVGTNSSPFAFNPERAHSFVGYNSGRVESSVQSELNTLAGRVSYAIESMRGFIGNAIGAYLPVGLESIFQQNWNVVVQQPAEASRYRLGSISDARILGSLSTGSDGQLTLTFRYVDGYTPRETSSFTFQLVLIETGQVAGQYSATLAGYNLPTAQNGSFDADAGVATEGTLGAVNAERYEIVSQPTLGTVELVDAAAGRFRYTGRPGNTRIDSFTFRAINRVGQSEPATIAVSLNQIPTLSQQVVGTWSVQNAESGQVYTLIVQPGGRGYYDVDGTTYDMSWQIRSYSNHPGYGFYETGFWHPAFDYLARDPLDYPVTGFRTYDQEGRTAQVYTKN